MAYEKLYIANIGQDMISKIFKTSQSSVSRHVRDCYKVPFKYLQGGCHV